MIFYVVLSGGIGRTARVSVAPPSPGTPSAVVLPLRRLRTAVDRRAIALAVVTGSIGLGLVVTAVTSSMSVPDLTWSLANLLMPGCALGVNHQARGVDDSAWTWLAAALLVTPVHSATVVLVAAFSEESVKPSGSLGAGIVVGLVTTACLVIARTRSSPRVDPVDPVVLTVVVVPLSLVAGVSAAWIGSLSDVRVEGSTAALLVRAALVVLVMGAALRVDRLRTGERAMLAGGLAGVMVGPLLLDAGDERVATSLLLVAGGLLGLLLISVRGRLRETTSPDDAVWSTPEPDPDDDVRRREQARAHEIRATVAGLAAVSRVLDTYETRLPPGDRRRLSEFGRTEMERLSRLVEADRPLPQDDLGRLLAAFAEGLRLQGCRVEVDIDPDCGPASLHEVVAPVLRTLTDNAARHAPGALVTITARRTADVLEVAVGDDGPGIPADVERSLFEWGARGPGSPGEGIGLQTARATARLHGGDLRLVDPPTPTGAAFVLTLPIGAGAP